MIYRSSSCRSVAPSIRTSVRLDLSSDKKLFAYARSDFVEMYPGIVAEEAKVPMVVGVGIVCVTLCNASLRCLIPSTGSKFHYIKGNSIGRSGISSWGSFLYGVSHSSLI